MIKLSGFVNLKPLKEEETKKPVNEASEVTFDELEPVQKKQVQLFEKIIGGKHDRIWDGINGYIVAIKVQSGRGAYRFDVDTMKKLIAAKARWVEEDLGNNINVAF